MSKSRHSQAWSMDIMIAVVLFIGALIFFGGYFLFAKDSASADLKKEAKLVLDTLTSPGSSERITDANVINDSRLAQFLTTDYNTLKQDLRIQNNFCVYLQDEEGNIIYLNSTATGKGDPSINVSDIPCWQ